MGGAASSRLRGPASARITRPKTAGGGLLARRQSPVDVGQRAKEMWYKGGGGVS